MSLWKGNDLANNAPVFQINHSNTADGNAAFNIATSKWGGVYSVNDVEMANTGGESKRVTHSGWQIRRPGIGPVTGVSIANAGLGYDNTYNTVRFSNGQYANGGANITTDANGSIVSVTIFEDGGANGGGGGFLANTHVVVSIVDELGANVNLPVKSATISNVGQNYAPTDLFRFSNGTSNATGTLTVNSSGAITGITFTNHGSGFPTNTAQIVLSFTNSSGGSANGTQGNLVPVVGGRNGNIVITTLGGRAGRVHYETLVAMSPTANGTNDDTQFPQ